MCSRFRFVYRYVRRGQETVICPDLSLSFCSAQQQPIAKVLSGAQLRSSPDVLLTLFYRMSLSTHTSRFASSTHNYSIPCSCVPSMFEIPRWSLCSLRWSSSIKSCLRLRSCSNTLDGCARALCGLGSYCFLSLSLSLSIPRVFELVLHSLLTEYVRHTVFLMFPFTIMILLIPFSLSSYAISAIALILAIGKVAVLYYTFLLKPFYDCDDSKFVTDACVTMSVKVQSFLFPLHHTQPCTVDFSCFSLSHRRMLWVGAIW